MADEYSAASLNNGGSYGTNQDPLNDWLGNTRAIAADQRQADLLAWEANVNSQEAAKNRQWEENMSNTAVQRKAADLNAAGFSSLGALGGASTPSGSTATISGGSTHSGKSSSMAPVLGSILGAGALIATKGMAMGAQSAQAAAAQAATNSEISSLVSLLEKPGISDEVRSAGIKSLASLGALGKLNGSSASMIQNNALSAKDRLGLADRIKDYDQTQFNDLGDEKAIRKLLQGLLERT